MTARQLHLGLFIYPGGHHIAGWRHPSVDASRIAHVSFYAEAARAAERGKFDLFFVGDMLAAREKDGRVIAEGGLNNIDSISICSAISSVTERLGLVATLSTTYNEPFTISERFASLDHLSAGRAGWNIITTQNDDAALNFSRDRHMEKTERYARAQEFVDVCTALWDSWDDGALVLDRDAGQFADPARIHPIHHAGDSFRVAGPARLPRPPQGWPVLVQAGGSPAGMAFAASTAEVIFSAQGSRENGITFRRAIHDQMAARGRAPESLKILPGLSPILGSTEAEARRKEAELEALVVPAVAIWILSDQLRFRLYDYEPAEPLPVAAIRANGSNFTPRVATMLDRVESLRTSIADCAAEVARSRSHGSFVGTPGQLADHMQRWLEDGACDGFNIMPAYFPAELDLFVDQVIPLLQRRGLFRQEYGATTLRGHLGLPVPERRR